MERRTLARVSVVAVLLFSAHPVWARQCPRLIKEGRETLAKVELGKGEEDKIRLLLDEAQKLHDNRGRAASVKKANEALGFLKKTEG